jgi:hypothetical protein
LTYATTVLVALAFAAALRVMRLVPLARSALQTAQSASRTMRDPALGDDSKERIVRQASIELMRQFLAIAGRSAAAVAISLIPLAALSAAGLVTWSGVTRALVTWQGIALATAAIAAATLVRYKT